MDIYVYCEQDDIGENPIEPYVRVGQKEIHQLMVEQMEIVMQRNEGNTSDDHQATEEIKEIRELIANGEIDEAWAVFQQYDGIASKEEYTAYVEKFEVSMADALGGAVPILPWTEQSRGALTLSKHSESLDGGFDNALFRLSQLGDNRMLISAEEMTNLSKAWLAYAEEQGKTWKKTVA